MYVCIYIYIYIYTHVHIHAYSTHTCFNTRLSRGHAMRRPNKLYKQLDITNNLANNVTVGYNK